MVARGRVQNGVVVLEDGVRLPEGQEVTVLVPGKGGQKAHSILDIEPVSVGSVLRPFTPEDDLLDEMLEGRSLDLLEPDKARIADELLHSFQPSTFAPGHNNGRLRP